VIDFYAGKKVFREMAGARTYDDAFNTGLGAGAELSWRFSDRLSCLAGIGYKNYDGRSHQGISFDDVEIVPVYAGGKFHIIPGDTRWDPYLTLLIYSDFENQNTVCCVMLKY